MKLHFYIARRFLLALFMVTGIFTVIFVMLDIVEHRARYSGDPEVTLGVVLRLVMLNYPGWTYQVVPLLVILASLFLFISLSRSSEMVVTRAAGRPALITVMSPVVVSILVGGLVLALFNPLAAGALREYQATEARLQGGESSVSSLGPEGLWLRQGTSEGQTVIQAREASGDLTLLTGVSFYAFDPSGNLRARIEAGTARLEPGYWVLLGAKVWDLSGDGGNAEQTSASYPEYWIRSNLTPDRLNENVSAASAVPVWQLPAFIEDLERAGFSAREFRVKLQSELALPLFLAAMVMLGAAFTMRHTRLGNTGLMVLVALILGFTIFFIRNFALVLGETGQIPPPVAAWTAPVAAILLATGILLHLEDG